MSQQEEDKKKKRRAALIILLLLIIIVAAAAALMAGSGDEKETHTVTVSIEGQGSSDPVGPITVDDGSSVSIAFAAADGWELSAVYVDGSIATTRDGVLTLSEVTADISVRAVFSERSTPAPTSYTLAVTTNDGGSADPTGASTRSVGETVRIAASPDDGYVIGDVKVDGTSVGAVNVVYVTMDSDHTVQIVFRAAVSTGDNADPTVSIDVDVVVTTRTTGGDTVGDDPYTGSFGTISPSGHVRVAYGGSLVVSMALNEGYALVSITAGGRAVDPALEFTVSDIRGSIAIEIVVSGPTFVITASAGAGGSISPTGETLVLIGCSQTFAISPGSGYRISSVTVDGASVGAVSSYTFEDVSTDHSISASFVRSSTPNPPTPTPTLRSLRIADAPSSVYVGDTPDFSGMSVTAVYSDGSTRSLTPSQYTLSPTPSRIDSAGTYTYTVSYGGVSRDVQVVAAVQQFTVAVSAGTGGTVSPTSLTVDRGTSYSVSDGVLTIGTTAVTATPFAGYDLSGWTLSTRTRSGTVSGDMTATASFVLHVYTVTVEQPSAGGTVSASATSGRMGDAIALTATPSAGYQFRQWSVTGAAVSGTETQTTITVGTSDITVSAIFEPIPVIVTVEVQGDGTVTQSSVSTVYGKTMAVSGSTLTIATESGSIGITAEPTAPSIFSQWALGGSVLTDTTLTQDVTVKAVFASLSSISISMEPTKRSYSVGETFDPSGMAIIATYSDGSTATVVYDAGAAGWSFTPSLATALTASDSSVQVSYYTASAVQVISVGPAVYTVTIQSSEHGSVSADLVSGASGTTVTLTVSPDTGYRLTTLTVGGSDVTSEASSGSYSFSLTADTTVSATFGPVPVESISLDPGTMVLGIGAGGAEERTIAVSYSPSYVIDSLRSVIWTSSDASVATVEADGKVTAVAAGTTTVTATLSSDSSITATCEVTVQDGMTVIVTKYMGQRTENGSRASFNESPGVALSSFSFDSSQMVPGMMQTVVVEVKNLTSSDLGISLKGVVTASGDGIADAFKATVVSGGSVVWSGSVKEMSEEGYIKLSDSLASGKDLTFALTLEFPSTGSVGEGSGNEAQGQSMTLRLEVTGSQPA